MTKSIKSILASHAAWLNSVKAASSSRGLFLPPCPPTSTPLPSSNPVHPIAKRFGQKRVRVVNRIFPSDFPLPPNVLGQELIAPSQPQVHTKPDIDKLRVAGRIARDILATVGPLIRKGLSTQDIDDHVYKSCLAAGVYPAPLGYQGFPKCVCTSINEVACHGIPHPNRLLDQGDIISVDVSIYTGEAFGDTCRSWVVPLDPNNDPTDVTFESGISIHTVNCLNKAAEATLAAGIAVCKPGALYKDIGRAVWQAALDKGHLVVDGICGHGIGCAFLHGQPQIDHTGWQNNRHERHKTTIMEPGHVFTVEPCLTQPPLMSFVRNRKIYPAEYTVSPTGVICTVDHTLTAQYEHMVLITTDGCEVLT